MEKLETVDCLEFAANYGIGRIACRRDDQHHLVVEVRVQGWAEIGLGISPVEVDLPVEMHVGIAPERIVDDGAVHPVVLCLQRLSYEEVALLQCILIDSPGNVDECGSGHNEGDDQ